MGNDHWNELRSRKSALTRALSSGRIPVSEWFAGVDSILHELDPKLKDAPHRFTLAAVRELERSKKARASAPRSKPRILVARKFKEARDFTRVLLEDEGYAVTTTGDGLEAFVELACGSYDLLVTGSILPHLFGVDLLDLKDGLGIKTPAIMQTLLPLEYAGGLKFRVPLDPRDCICGRKMEKCDLDLMRADWIDSNRKVLGRVKEHLPLA